ncbi:hypothetical protein JADG_010931 [Aureobasidium aubasidani]|nr:hypothetical protein JADG_010931 [Aureobasidium pullulans]
MVETQARPVTPLHNTHQLSNSDLLERIHDLTLQLRERDARVEELIITSNPRRTDQIQPTQPLLIPSEVQEPPIYEEPINLLLPPHFTETWLYDMKYQDELREAYVSEVDPFFVLAENDFAAALASEPLTSKLRLMEFSLKDDTRPYELLAVYGIFLQDVSYSKQLDITLHEIMRKVAAVWEVGEKLMRYMVWNENIEDERIESDSETCHAGRRGKIRAQIYRAAGF